MSSVLRWPRPPARKVFSLGPTQEEGWFSLGFVFFSTPLFPLFWSSLPATTTFFFFHFLVGRSFLNSEKNCAPFYGLPRTNDDPVVSPQITGPRSPFLFMKNCPSFPTFCRLGPACGVGRFLPIILALFANKGRRQIKPTLFYPNPGFFPSIFPLGSLVFYTVTPFIYQLSNPPT